MYANCNDGEVLHLREAWLHATNVLLEGMYYSKGSRRVSRLATVSLTVLDPAVDTEAS